MKDGSRMLVVVFSVSFHVLYNTADGSSSVGSVTCDTVSSTSSSRMEIGRLFDSAKAVMDYVDDFAKTHFHPLRRSSCTTIEAYNRKV